MLLNQTLDKLNGLGLFGMAIGLREQLESTQYANLFRSHRPRQPPGPHPRADRRPQDSGVAQSVRAGGGSHRGGHRG